MLTRLRIHKESGSTYYYVQELTDEWRTLQINITYYEPSRNRNNKNLPMAAGFSTVEEATQFAINYRRCLEVPDIEIKFYHNCINTRSVVYKVEGFYNAFENIEKAFSAHNERRLEVDIEV